MNPLIQAAPSHRDRDAKPQPLSYLLAIAVIVGGFAAAALVTGLIPPAHAKLQHDGASGGAAQSGSCRPAAVARDGEEKPCVG